jgi:predicted 2-oxoglutarate/Fe(II)-dependent dioxygenase YbiX
MIGSVATRTDLSVTLFLSNISDYAGGELALDAKPELGEAIAVLEAQNPQQDVRLRLRANRGTLLRMWVEA